MNKYCVVFGRRSLAAAMRNQVEPSRSDGLFAAGALWVGGHCFSLPLPHYLGHHSPRQLESEIVTAVADRFRDDLRR
jgi:hypothetical protein